MSARLTVSALALLGGFVTLDHGAEAIPPSEATAATPNPSVAPVAAPARPPTAVRPAAPLARPAPTVRAAVAPRPVVAVAPRPVVAVAPHPAATSSVPATTAPVTPATATPTAPTQPAVAMAPARTTPLTLRPGRPLSLIPANTSSGNGWKVLALAAVIAGGVWFAKRKQPVAKSDVRRPLEIVRRTAHSRKLVRQVSRGESTDIFRTRQSTLDAHLLFLDAQWAEGCRNSAELWRRLQVQGYQGSLRVVSEWMTRRRRAERATNQQLQKVPSARTISRLMTTARDHLSKAETITIAAIEACIPTLVEARKLVERFQAMLRQRLVVDLDSWIAIASTSLIASFANGIIKDKAAVCAAITESWSNGQTEGQITKLKLVKRQMYGRAKIDLLQARLIGAA